ncbi:MAG: TIM barrel protein, partial [Clostridia bacterium]|nr:TIM barrel protein [Clostridia bacterium]
MAKFLISAFADEAHNGIDGQIEALKRNGLFCIEPRAMNLGPVIAKTDEELAEIKRRFDEEGIIGPSFGSPIGKYKITDDFEPHLELFRRALYVCKVFGAKRMRIFSFFVEQDKLDEYRDEVIRRMKIMVAEAAEAGVTLCHENEGEIYGQDPERVADLLASVPGLRGIY